MVNEMPSVDAYHDAKRDKSKAGCVKSGGAPSLVRGIHEVCVDSWRRR